MQQPSSTVSSPNNSPMPECIEFWGSSRIQELSFHLDADRVVMFNNAESPFSTFYKVNIRISGVHYPSVENYYQACKIYSLIGNYAVWNFKNLKDGFSAKKNAKSVIKKEGISPKVVESWKNEGGVQAVFYATYYKFKQNPRLRKRLFQTGDNLIVHDYKNDKIYSSGCDKETLLNWLADHDGKLLHVVFDARNFNNNSFPLIAEGHNVVGYVTMMVREKLKEEYPQEFEIAQTSVEDQSQNNSEDIDKVVRGVGNI
ncbi:hypothetical protein FO519_002647 [Halicephalobus sp. NKZ332]|nr:hypothetical protein FO519_002647 [Halicephalobus sp. NKZ332]